MQTLLLIGCGDVARRATPWLTKRFRVIALLRDPDNAQEWRDLGCSPLIADLDQPRTLQRLQGLAQAVLHLAPPPLKGLTDTRTRNLLNALGTGKGASLPARLVYVSTTGVYGDGASAEINETAPCAPKTDRAHRRVSAETQLRDWGRQTGCRVTLLRAPGIYAAERLPEERLRQGLPALVDSEDVFTNHIHADDLARACCLALFRGKPGRAINVSDDSALKMGDYFDAVADACHLPRPPRLSRQALEQQVSPVQLSFMSESRRIQNHRLKHELRLKLAYPTVADTLAAINQAEMALKSL